MSGNDRQESLLRQYDHWAVYLSDSQTFLGRSYIALGRDGEVDPFTDTTPQEQAELLTVVSGLKQALTTLYQPDLLNYANFRNTWHHCHWHVIPRYAATRTVLDTVFVDPNFGRNYAPYPAHSIPGEVFSRIGEDLATELAAQANR